MDWGLKKWNEALSDGFVLDKHTFLICTLIPISYVEMVGNENLIVVELSEIRKHTDMVKVGCDELIKKGFAKWQAKGNNPNKGLDKLIIGTSPDFITENYFFETKKRFSAVTTKKGEFKSTRKKVTTVPEEDSEADFSETIEVLDEWFEKYKGFCKKVSLDSKAEKIYKKIKGVLNNASRGVMKHTDLLTYLDCVNAMVYDWMDVPTRYSNMKEKNMAKQVLNKHSPSVLIRLVPYFVEHYPDMAKEGYEETNVYMLSFHSAAVLRKMEKRSKGSKNRNFEQDAL